MNEKELCLLIVIGNAVISLLYLLFVKIKEKDTGKAVAGSLVILFTLGFGAVYLSLSSLYYHLVSKNFEKQVNLDELSFSKEKNRYYSLEDVETAKDKVPLEEVIRVGDIQVARKNFLSILKSDYIEYIRLINDAVSDKDSEISHYAATAIVDTISRFKKEFEIEINSNEREQFVMKTAEFLKTGILSEHDVEYYTNRLEEAVMEMEVSDILIYSMSDLYLHQNENVKAEEWIKKADVLEEKNIYIYKALLKFYYCTGEQLRFKEMLEELKASDVALDHQLLELIRMYI